MTTAKQSRRKPSVRKLEPIDWHEFANDAVLNGNMSTLFQRPAAEDPSAYASPEALVEIEKRGVRPGGAGSVIEFGTPAPSDRPTVGQEPTVCPEPTVGAEATVGTEHTVGPNPVSTAPMAIAVEIP